MANSTRRTIKTMVPFKAIDVTPKDLILTHGKDAPKIIMSMIDRAIEMDRNDKALELDRVRREVARALGA